MTGSISNDHKECLENRSVIEALMTDLTEPQTQVGQKNAYKHQAPKPAHMANDIDGTFNCVSHERLIDILTHYPFPTCLVNCNVAVNTDWRIHMAFNVKREEPVPFSAGLPQGSLLSPILFVIYSGALHSRSKVKATAYVDDEVALKGAGSRGQRKRGQESSLFIKCTSSTRTIIYTKLSTGRELWRGST